MDFEKMPVLVTVTRIKFVLVATFILSLLYLFAGAWRALADPPRVEVTVEAPASPPVMAYPTLKDGATSDEFETYLKKAQAAQETNARAIDKYVAQVSAYEKAVTAEISSARAKSGDRSGRVTAFEKVIKDTIGSLILTPLIAALIVYSGINVAGQVALAKLNREPPTLEQP